MTPLRPLHPAIRSALVALIALVAGFCYITILYGLDHSAPWRFAGLRVFIAGCAVLAIAMVLRRPVFPAPGRRAWIVPLGFFATALTFGAMFFAPLYIGAGTASVIGNLQPLFIVVLAWAFLGERFTLARAAAVGLGIVGVSLIASGDFVSATGSATGIVIALFVSAGAAIGTVMYRYIAPGDDWLAVSGWQLLAGSGMLLAASIIATEPAIHWSPGFVGALAFLALAETTLVTLIWFWLLRRAEASALAPNLFFVPIVGLSLAVILRGEQLAVTGWLGSGVILLGIGAGIWGDSRAPRRLTADTNPVSVNR